MYVLLVALLLGLSLRETQGYWGNYHCEEGRDVMVHLFEWKHTDVARECEEFLADAGFCGVQVSPPNEHRVINGDHPDGPHVVFPWWQRYQPVSYLMDSRSGSEAEFIDMVQRCNDVGVSIYVDAVINHMAQTGSGVGSAGSLWDGTASDFPGVPWVIDDFHGPDVCGTSDGNIQDYQNATEVRVCRLNELRDLAHGEESVRTTIAEQYLNKLVGWGVAGFRLDASKHMYPDQIEDMLNRLENLNTTWFPEDTRPFIFMEVIDQGGEPISADEYTPMGRVTEFKFCRDIGNIFRGNNGHTLTDLQDLTTDFIPAEDAVAFIDNHDNQRGHGAGGIQIITFREPTLYVMANAFELAWPYGYVRIMSSYVWPLDVEDGYDKNNWMGPPSDENGNTNDVECFGDWACEHRWRQIRNMVKFRNRVAGTPLLNWWDNGNNTIAFGRGDRGFIFINNEGTDVVSPSLSTGLPDGEYCDVIGCDNPTPPCGNSAGTCGEPIRVSGGMALFEVPNANVPVVAIYAE